MLTTAPRITDRFFGRQAVPTPGEDYDIVWSPKGDRVAMVGRDGSLTLTTADTLPYAYVRPLISGEGPPSIQNPHRSERPSSVARRHVRRQRRTDQNTGHPRTPDTERLQWFLFILGRDGTYQKVIHLTPKVELSLTSEMSVPAWSSDGQRLYFAARIDQESNATLYYVVPDGGKIKSIVELEGGHYEAVKMSPTGERVLLVSQLERPDFYQPEPVDSALYAIGTDGQEQRQIWQGYANASWSPDGQDTAVPTPRLPDDTWIWITDPTGAVRTPLIKPDADGDAIAAGAR